MADRGEATAQAAITADVGANLVAVLVILLVAAGLTGAVAPRATDGQMHVAVTSVPLSGKAQSDVLYQRLRPAEGVLVVELTAVGAFVPAGDRMIPLAEVARPWPTVAAVFVFSARHHGAFLELAKSQGVQSVEVTVPQALRRVGEEVGVSAFSGAFLGIRAGADPASIRPPLLRLLQAGPAAAGVDPGEAASAQHPQSTLARMAAWLRVGGNLFLLCLGAALLFALRRRLV